MRGIKSLIIGAVIAVGAFVGVGLTTPAAPAHAGDCDNNAVVYCGVTSISSLRTAYTKNDRYTQQIFSYFGISSTMVNSGKYASGSVTKDGKIVVGGKTVATNALTAGRQYMPGSTTVKLANVTIYTRTPSVSFMQSSLPAIVFYNADGSVSKAVIMSCGNPVTATPVPAPKPVPTPVYTCKALTATKIDRVTYDFKLAYTASGGATFKNYSMNYGDGKTATGLTNLTTRHQYANPGNYTITATVYFNTPSGVKSAACQTKITVEKPLAITKPAVAIAKTVNQKESEIVKVGEPFTYELKVTNTGNVVLKDTVVTDKAPANVTFKSSAGVGTIANNVWSTKVSLAVGESKTFKITAVLDKYVAGEIVNNACVDATEVTGTPDDCDTAVITTPKEGEIIVCVVATKEIKTIKESEFNATTMTQDMSQCAEQPVVPASVTPQTPAAPAPELPRTGLESVFGGGLGLSTLAGAAYYYGESRRRVRSALRRG